MIFKQALSVGALSLLSLLSLSAESESSSLPRVVIATSLGDITLELNEEKAPETVANFLSYTDSGFFEETIFHRVMDGFMIQGGGFELKENGDVSKKATQAPIQNEANNGLSNVRGSVAMARTGNPHSATAQFFINHVDNTKLDYPSFDEWGYAVFAKVVEGIDIVDKIAKVSVKTLAPGEGGNVGMRPMENVPVEPVIILSVKRLEEETQD